MEKCCPKCFRKYPHSVERCEDDGSYLFIPGDRDLTGEVLDDRYTVLECIGRGGMGVVYKAEQAMLKRVVALKVLRREIVQDEQSVKRFMREAQAIASLKCRYTVTVHDFGVTKDGLLYYTMELLEGQPLSQLIERQGPVNPYRAARLILQTCESLKEAHQLGILHRDLKPDNLFLVSSGESEEVRVVDFGIAKLLDESAKEAMTSTGMIVGTPRYLSPEQALGNDVVPASDMYSLSICLYEMLAGVPPFLAETPMKTMWAHIRDPVPILKDLNPLIEVPKNLELFLATALQKEPAERYQSAVEFRDALRRALEEHSSSPETVSLGPLATTDEGLRVLTQVWDAKKAEAAGGTSPNRVLETAQNNTGGLLPGEVEEGVPAFATKPGMTRSGPLQSGISRPPSEVVVPATPAPFQGQMTPQELQGMGHAMTMVAPELKDLSQALEPKFPLGKAIAGVVLLLVVCGAVLAVWQPWSSGGLGGAQEISDPGPQDVVPAAKTTATEEKSEEDSKPVIVKREAPAKMPEVAAAVPSSDITQSPPQAPAVAADVISSAEVEAVKAPGGTNSPAPGEAAVDTRAEQKKMEEERAEAEAETQAQLQAQRAGLLQDARSDLRSGQYESALESLTKAGELAGGPDNEIRQLTRKCRRGARERKIQAFLKKARGQQSKGNLEDALRTLGQAEKVDSSHPAVKKLQAELRKLKSEQEAMAREARELELLKFEEEKKKKDKEEKKKDDKELEQLKF